MSNNELVQGPISGIEQKYIKFGDNAVKFKLDRLYEAFNLRVKLDDIKSVCAVESQLNIKLPRLPNTTKEIKPLDSKIFWLGPDEWLVICHNQSSCLKDKVSFEEEECQHIGWVDVTDSRSLICLSGPSAHSVLEKGCPLDLHLNTFPVNSCSQSVIGQASVLIHRLQEHTTMNDLWEIYVELSFTSYLWSWLLDAAAEYEPII